MECMVAREDAHLIILLPLVEAHETLLARILGNFACGNECGDLRRLHLAQSAVRNVTRRCGRWLAAHRRHRAKELHHEHEVATRVARVRGEQRVLVVVAAAAHKEDEAGSGLRRARRRRRGLRRLGGRLCSRLCGGLGLCRCRTACLRAVIVGTHEALTGAQRAHADEHAWHERLARAFEAEYTEERELAGTNIAAAALTHRVILVVHLVRLAHALHGNPQINDQVMEEALERARRAVTEWPALARILERVQHRLLGRARLRLRLRLSLRLRLRLRFPGALAAALAAVAPASQEHVPECLAHEARDHCHALLLARLV